MQTWIEMRGKPRFKSRFACIEDLVLRHGREYRGAKPRWLITPRACFQDSYMRARRSSKWIYTEGFATNPLVGMYTHHAWLTREDRPGLAYDAAWFYEDARDSEYIGIQFRFEYVKSVFEASGRTMFSVLEAPWLRYELVTGARPIEEVLWTPGERIDATQTRNDQHLGDGYCRPTARNKDLDHGASGEIRQPAGSTGAAAGSAAD